MEDLIDRKKAMAEYIDKARLLEYIRSDPVGRWLCERNNLDGAIEAFPASDVAEIVMCKDCAKRSFTKCPMALSRQSDFDFCSRAEKKEVRAWDD